jgi:hypothetical protein
MKMEEAMEFKEFVEKYDAGKLKVHVDRNAAGFMYEAPSLIPQNIRKRQAMQRFVAFAGVAGGLVSFVWLPWWGAALILVFFFASFRQIQSAAVEGVLEAALQNEAVFRLANERKVLIIKETAG